jgi:hypothetical protein
LELKNKLGFEEAWKNRKLFVEAREVTDYDHFGIGTDLKEDFITIKGKKYIVSIVC